MVIYLHHVRHGTKVATTEQEAKNDEKNGWFRYVPGEHVVIGNEPGVESLEIANSENALVAITSPKVINRRRSTATGG